jgi:tetratricopeptide (TPR) repeat protein
LLKTAEDRLLQAQEINPLNTDHTANLARLYTRWAEISEGDERLDRISAASIQYEAAMTLSPQNAVIANEYARLALLLESDCDKALNLYDHSIEADPFFADTLLDRTEAYIFCADRQEEADRDPYYSAAAESLTEALNRRSGDSRRWLQLANLHILLGNKDEAEEAYLKASERAGDDLPQWQIDYTVAQWFLEAGDPDAAVTYAQLALQSAPEDTKSAVEQFLNNISAQGENSDG